MICKHPEPSFFLLKTITLKTFFDEINRLLTLVRNRVLKLEPTLTCFLNIELSLQKVSGNFYFLLIVFYKNRKQGL